MGRPQFNAANQFTGLLNLHTHWQVWPKHWQHHFDLLLSSISDPQATVNLATETALVHVLVPKGSKGQNGAPSPQALAAGDKLTQVRHG